MADIFPPAKQRPALLQLAAHLDSRTSALRKDECGDWAIFGNNGHIYAVPVELDSEGRTAKVGFQLMIGSDYDNTRRVPGAGRALDTEGRTAKVGFQLMIGCARSSPIARSPATIIPVECQGLGERQEATPDDVLRPRMFDLGICK